MNNLPTVIPIKADCWYDGPEDSSVREILGNQNIYSHNDLFWTIVPISIVAFTDFDFQIKLEHESYPNISIVQKS